MRILSIDYGAKRIGIAIGDDELRIVKPLCVLKNNKYVIDHIKKFVEDYSIDRIVVGNPLRPSGGKSKMSQVVEDFAKNLRSELRKVDVILWDERYSTEEAEYYIRGLSPKKRKEMKDKISACIILMDFLERYNE